MKTCVSLGAIIASLMLMTTGCGYDHANRSGPGPVPGSPGSGTNTPTSNTPGLAGSTK